MVIKIVADKTYRSFEIPLVYILHKGSLLCKNICAKTSPYVTMNKNKRGEV